MESAVKPNSPKPAPATSPAPVAGAKTAPELSKTPQQTVVRTNKPEEVNDQAKKLGIKVTAEIKLPSGDTLVTVDSSVDSPAVTALAAQSGAKVSPNYTYKAFLSPNDTNFGDQWNLTKIKAPEAWDITAGSSDVTIAVIDTGVLFNQSWSTHDYSQPDFPSGKKWINTAETAGNGIDDDGNGYIDDREGWDFMGGFRGPDADCPNLNDSDDYEDPDDSNFLYMDNDPQPYSCDSPFEPTELNKTHYNGTCDTFDSACAVGHGTMVASVAAAASNNNSLIAGVDHNAKIMNLRVMDGYGFSDSLRIIAAVEYAAEMGADVINMSLGLFTSLDDCSGTDDGLQTAMAAAKAAGVTIVAASGNTGSRGVCFPANSIHAIAVGASTSTDARASFSTYGPELDVIAPGVGIPAANAVSNADPTEYIEVSGTSFASPHVAGLASLIKGQLPGATPTDIRSLISQRADKVSGMGGNSFTNLYGHGRINLFTAISVTDGNEPVYRLYHPRVKNHFYTTNPNERDSAIGLGYRNGSIRFWVPQSSTGNIPVYRLYHPRTKKHFYTTNPNERDSAISLGYRNSGVRFWVPASATGNIPVYRLYHPTVKKHFYTTSTAERDKAIQSGYRNGGIRFYTLPI